MQQKHSELLSPFSKGKVHLTRFSRRTLSSAFRNLFAVLSALCLLSMVAFAQTATQPPPPLPSDNASATTVPAITPETIPLTPVEGLASATSERTGPEEVMTGFYLISAGKLDFQNSTLPLDFYFWMTFPGSETPKIEFMNSRNFTLSPQATQVISGPNGTYQNICYRVTGTFDQELDMQKYPFDRFSIRILAEDTEKTSRERIFVPDTSSSGIDQSFRILGWNVVDKAIRSASHTYASTFGIQSTESGQETYSQVAFELHISREHTVIFIKIVSPVLLFLAIAILGLFLHVDQISQKISLSVAALFSSVAYHINVTQGLPPVGYLTFIDRMMIGQYLVIFVNLVFCVGLFWANRNEHTRLEKTLLYGSRILIPIAAASVLWFLFSQVDFV